MRSPSGPATARSSATSPQRARPPRRAAARARPTTEDEAVAAGMPAADVDGDGLPYRVVAAPQHGRLTPFDPATGAFTYIPDADYNGPDAFTFRAGDGKVLGNIA